MQAENIERQFFQKFQVIQQKKNFFFRYAKKLCRKERETIMESVAC